MFSKDNGGDDLFSNSTFDTSNPDKIIIREKSSSKKKVRRRVKKGTKDQVLLKKESAVKADKVKVVSKKTVKDAKSETTPSPAKAKSVAEKYTLPRLSDIEKKKDDYDGDLGTEFRKASADWKDTRFTQDYPDFDSSDNDTSSGSGFFSSVSSSTPLQWIALALAIVIMVSSVFATSVYAKSECKDRRTMAMSKISSFEESSFEQVALEVESVEEPIYYEEPVTEQGSVLTLVLSSVEKDLKIKLVDEEDRLVKNVQWSVTITDSDGNSSEESDEDQDGIIHMTDVSAGDYSVELNSTESLSAYELPMSAQSVSVKAKVEYKVIADIKKEIKSEKEVNPAVEDKGNQHADVETSTPANNDTVEFCESTKTLVGDDYVEAVVDLTKTVATAKQSTLASIIDNLKNISSGRTVISPVAASMIYASEEPVSTDTTEEICTHNFGSNNENPTCSLCGAANPDYQVIAEETACTHATLKYEKIDSTHHKVICSLCSAVVTESADCDFSNGACVCGNTKTDTSHTLTYTSNNNGTHKVTCSVSECSENHNKDSETCVYEDGKCKYCGYSQPANTYKLSVSNGTGGGSYTEGATVTVSANIAPTGQVFASWTVSGVTFDDTQKKSSTVSFKMPANDVTLTAVYSGETNYSDDAQLYDSEKNALYVYDGSAYRLAKYKDYKDNPSQKFFKKQEGYKYTGWQTIDGKTYYYTKDNQYVTGDQVIGGVKYHFGTDGVLSQGSGTLGIDVSKYQPSINWSSVKASGVNYVIIRCGYRGASTGVLIEDPYFKSHIKGAKAAGLKVGVYFFTTALTEAEAVEEASMVAYLCQGYGIDYPVFMDCESSSRAGYNGMSASQRTAIIKAFCNTIRSAGYTPGVYANKTWLTSYMNVGELSGFKIWLAQYNTAGPTYTGRYDLWQYTSKGSVNGISGNVDMNQSYLGY